MSAETLFKVHNCCPAFEQSICALLITAYQGGFYTLNREAIVELFNAEFGETFGGNRYNAWINCYGIVTGHIATFNYIRSDSPSIVAWSNCIMFGGCDDPPSPCPQTHFVNLPT